MRFSGLNLISRSHGTHPLLKDSRGPSHTSLRDAEAKPELGANNDEIFWADTHQPRKSVEDSSAMSLLNNHASLTAARTIFSVMGKNRVLGRDRWPKTRDGVLLACVHLSHYDPFAIGVLLRRPVAWMARIESFATPWTSWLTRSCGGFPVDRFGFALPGIREGIQRVNRGELVGIFPEGEVMGGDRSVLNGAPMKQGVGVIARRTGAPVVPCIVVNSSQFSNVKPWLPLKAGELWLGLGDPLYADQELPPGRASRAELTRRLEDAFRELHREMIDTFEIPPNHAP